MNSLLLLIRTNPLAAFYLLATGAVVLQSTVWVRSPLAIQLTQGFQSWAVVWTLVALMWTAYRKLLKHSFKWKMWASAVGVSCITFPFTLAPELGFGWLSVCMYGLVLALAPAAWTYLLARTPKARVDWRNPALAGFLLGMGWMGLETLARLLPGSPYTYRELNMKESYSPGHAIIDSSAVNPLWRQMKIRDSIISYPLAEFQQTLKFNNWGFNDRNWPKMDEVKTDTLLWLAMGDSFTEGIGAAQDSTWGRLLEHRLAQSQNTQPIRLLNAGFSGADPLQNFVLLDTLSQVLKPRQVIWAVNESDFYEIQERGSLAERLQSPYYLLYEYPFGLSFIFRRIFIHVFKYDYAGNSPNKQEVKRKKTQKKLINLRINLDSLAKVRRFGIHIFFHPTIDEFNKARNNEMVLSNENADYFFPGSKPLLPCYLQNHPQTAITQLYWPIDRHHTPAGYQLMADCIYENLPDSLKRPIAKQSK